MRLPPGRFKLATSPASTGSAAVRKTIGIVLVAALAATIAGVLPGVAITVTLRRNKVSDYACECTGLPMPLGGGSSITAMDGCCPSSNCRSFSIALFMFSVNLAPA